DLLQGCLESIANSTAWPAHLIVVHQGSSPRVAAWVDRLAMTGLHAECVASDGDGAAAARNRGFELARTRFVAATDDDCLVYPDWLERLTTRLHARPTAMITGRVDDVGGDHGATGAPSLILSDEPMEYVRPRLDRDPLFSNNMGFALEVVERIGPMDEHPTVRYAEDAEWSYRALRACVPIVYAPDVRTSHLAWRDRAQMHETYRRYARSQGGFYGHYLHRGDLFIARRIAFELLRAPWLVLRGLATRNPDLAEMGQAYLAQLVPGMIHGWRRAPT
ncbi:MAG TPA: glycosyltransferase, partial [Gemmatimonadaceae bacterium]|nr:glycosyltransferase [Gemmatimonadaceae bacterium]